MGFEELGWFRCVSRKRPLGDNFVFFLCYRWTVLILLAFSFVVTSKLWFGYSFTCTNMRGTLFQVYLNSMCYGNVYTLPTEDMNTYKEYTSDDKYRRYHPYYAWVNLLFLVQALIFYLPHLLWKSYERGYLRKLTCGVEKFFCKEEKRGLELCYLAKYVVVTQGKHEIYTLLYIFFEVCNFALALAQTVWLVCFFDVTGTPSSLPVKIHTWEDFRNFYFPFLARCYYVTVASSGEAEKEIIKCLMPLNHLHMVMFLFLHAWYVFVTVLCGLVLIYRISLIAPFFRALAMRWVAPLAEKSVLKSLCDRLSYSDWFFLTRLQKVMIDVDFAQMVDKIAVVSQVKSIESEKEDEHMFSFCENGRKELDSSTATSPL